MATVEIEVTPELIELVKHRDDLATGKAKPADFIKDYHETCKLICMEILRWKVQQAILSEAQP